MGVLKAFFFIPLLSAILKFSSLYCSPSKGIPGARFSKASETFRAHKDISKNGVTYTYTPKTSCIKETSLHFKNICNHWRFCCGFPGAKSFSGPSRNVPGFHKRG